MRENNQTFKLQPHIVHDTDKIALNVFAFQGSASPPFLSITSLFLFFNTVASPCCSIKNSQNDKDKVEMGLKLVTFITTASDFRHWYSNNTTNNSYSTHHSPSSYGTTLWIKHQTIASYTTQYSLYCTLWTMYLQWSFLLIWALLGVEVILHYTQTHTFFSRGFTRPL